jgi:uncharacterized protein (TIRG00374 family)
MASTSRSTRRALIVAAAVAGVTLIVLAFVYIPTLRASLVALRHLNWGFAVLAVMAESGSMAATARSQRRLIHVGGKEVPLSTAIGLTYASNALAASLPLAGAGVGAAFSYRHLRQRGIDSAVVSWALTLAGVVSSLAFALVMTVGALVSGKNGAVLVGLVGAAFNALPVLAVLAGLRFPAVRRLVDRVAAGVVGFSRRLFGRPRAEAADAFEDLLRRIVSLHATPRQYGLAFASAVRNWAADCLCLTCAILATGGHVPWRGLLLAYCLAKTTGSLGLTPGGIGIVEATLTAALVGAGMPGTQALPAVLVYRLISFWLVLAVGYTTIGPLARQRPADALVDDPIDDPIDERRR